MWEAFIPCDRLTMKLKNMTNENNSALMLPLRGLVEQIFSAFSYASRVEETNVLVRIMRMLITLFHAFIAICHWALPSAALCNDMLALPA